MTKASEWSILCTISLRDILVRAKLQLISLTLRRGFNKFLQKRVLKSNRRVHLLKARRAFDRRGVRMLPRKILRFQTPADAFSCIFGSVFVALLFHFFAPKSTNLNKFEENYVTIKQSQSTISIEVLLFNTFTTGIFKMV